jgi:adrenodoxin-NADP+ reductase
MKSLQLPVVNLKRIFGSRVGRRSFSATTGSLEKYYIAIVGSGPSGFYTAKYLLEQNDKICIDVYEKLPFPYGLVRYGVAPDHPEVKTVTNTFEDLFNNPKSKERIRFFGNVEIGEEAKRDETCNLLPLPTLMENYSSVILAYGAYSDHPLHLPKENDLSGVLSSREIVNWYNGHPDFQQLHESKHLKDPKTGDYRPIRSMIIIGNGNVALDVARVCMKDVKELAKTDITPTALEWITFIQKTLERVYIVGRRGHIQGSYTIKELRELTKINQNDEHVPLYFPNDELAMGSNPASLKEIENNRPKKRIIELIQNVASKSNEMTFSQLQRRMEMRFLLSPKEFKYNSETNEINSVVFQRNELTGESGHQKAQPTKEDVTLPCDLLVKAIGYKSISIHSLIPFSNKSNTVINQEGQAIFPSNSSFAKFQNRLYVTGWLKRGPTGIILSNIYDAKETTAKILNTIKAGESIPLASADPVEKLSEINPKVFQNNLNWKDIQKLNQLELEKGEKENKVRDKFLSVAEMIRIAKSQ